MEHCTRDGKAKILKECTLPLTCKGKVQTIVTEKAVFRINNGLVLEELSPGVSIDDVRNCTEADFTISPDFVIRKDGNNKCACGCAVTPGGRA
jgi:acyl CoA:acetate/3-ketoacid CoA transferase beta subunit